MQRECSVEGCSNPSRTKTTIGMCELHRQRWRRSSSLERLDHGVTFADRFNMKVDRSEGCWLWTGSRFGPGYGKIMRDGRSQSAHRVAWELTFGPIPDDLHVLHRCDNPPCVNPAHLFLGTHTDNMRDRNDKGRNPNRLKTHCPIGHPYEGENLYVDPRGYRQCRTCVKERRARVRAA